MKKSYSKRSYLILGAGREGQATARYLTTRYPGVSCTIADIEEVEGDVGTAKKLYGDDYPDSLKSWDVTVVSPGIPPSTTLLKTAKEIWTATNIFLEECTGVVVGITGSKGKSTTSALLHHLLVTAERDARLVGNIGTPALDELLQPYTDETVFVFEMSSYQTSRLQQGPEYAVLLSLFPEHIDYHGSVEQYYADKLCITTTQTAEQHVYYNSQDEELHELVQETAAQKHAFPSTHSVQELRSALYYTDRHIIDLEDLPLIGAHNTMNAIAACTLAIALDVPVDSLAQGLKTFAPLSHRLETVGTFQEITFIDDAISTSPESTLAALEAVPNVSTLLLGGQDRGYDFSTLAEKIKELEIQNIILFPDTGKQIRNALQAQKYLPQQVLETSSMEEAVRFAYTHTPPGEVCLLSCASPSYSVFKNFEDRGDQFQEAIKKLA